MEKKDKKRKSDSLIRLFSLAMLFVFMAGMQLNAQNIMVSGTVVDNNDGSSIPGVNVLIKGTTQGTITDLDGNYKIEVASSQDVLVFSYIGYKAIETVVGEKTVINVRMQIETKDIDEIVVLGYGGQKRSDLTGAVASVSAEKINSVPIPSVEHALQGMAAGVNIIPKSGKPGEGVDIQIRGVSSINGTQPLVIIDGVYGDLNQLNPADIASIEVLKDASSAAIYGSTGGNGVILVTTKKGKSGKMNITANIYRGYENAVNTIEMMNSQEYLEILEEIDSTKDIPLNYRPDTLPTYDWQDMAFQQAISESYDVSISGGNDVSTYLFSSSLNKQGGIVNNTDYQRFTIRMNSEHKVNKYITFDEKITYVNTQTDGFDDWVWHGFYNTPIVGIICMDPTVPAYDEKGVWTLSPFNVGNPMPNIDMMDKVKRNNKFEGNLGMKINLFKGLDYQTRIVPKFGLFDEKEYQAIYYASPTNRRDADKLIQRMSKDLSYNFQNYINYQTTIAESHNISAMVGMEASKWWWYDIGGSRLDMASAEPYMLYLSKSTNSEDDLQNVTGSGGIGANQGYFGRLNYDYKGIYLLTFNVRRDGSNSFGTNYRWGTFPSFSLGWKFSEMRFMDNAPFVSFGKLRFGYGQTGANAKSGFPYLSTVVTRQEFRYTVDGATTQVGTAPNQIANPDLRWESVNMSNLGLDMTFFENRISFNLDLFNKVNDGMIDRIETNYIAGTFNADKPEANFGSISNKGYEITISARKNEGELTGSVDVNFSQVKNKVLELATDSMQAGAIHTVNPTSITIIGNPISQFYGYQIEGMFSENDPTIVDGKNIIITNQPFSINASGDTVYAQKNAKPGDARFKDVNGDGKLTIDDRVLLGSPLPKFTFGFTLNLQYKGFDLTAFINGTYGNKIMNGSKQYVYEPIGYKNRAKEFTNRYRDEIIKDGIVVVKENHNTDLYRMSAETYTRMSDFYVEDGSFLRLRNLMLGYTIPASLSNKVGVEKLRIYAGGKNLFTLTKYTGLNPEVGGIGDRPLLAWGVDIGLYPVTKMVYFGANIVF
ncbi:MAG: TonB-dependent receptor [Bacteroidales bacterium]|nr:TonB-dependent receptor [Bacteroidales bacterium]